MRGLYREVWVRCEPRDRFWITWQRHVQSASYIYEVKTEKKLPFWCFWVPRDPTRWQTAQPWRRTPWLDDTVKMRGGLMLSPLPYVSSFTAPEEFELIQIKAGQKSDCSVIWKSDSWLSICCNPKIVLCGIDWSCQPYLVQCSMTRMLLISNFCLVSSENTQASEPSYRSSEFPLQASRFYHLFLKTRCNFPGDQNVPCIDREQTFKTSLIFLGLLQTSP